MRFPTWIIPAKGITHSAIRTKTEYRWPAGGQRSIPIILLEINICIINNNITLPSFLVALIYVYTLLCWDWLQSWNFFFSCISHFTYTPAHRTAPSIYTNAAFNATIQKKAINTAPVVCWLWGWGCFFVVRS